MRRWLPALLLVTGAAEVVAFVALGQLVGFGLTVLLVLAASLLGTVLLRREGLRAWRGFRAAATAGDPPGGHVTDGLVGLGGALLLAVPGLVTGVLGSVTLVPPVRGLARSQLQGRLERRMSSHAAGEMFGPRRVRVRWEESHPAGADAEVVEGEIIDDR